MIVALRYQSRGGNTKMVAEAIAKAAEVKAESIAVPIDAPVDLLFVGGGVYAWAIDPALKNFLENLTPDDVTCIAAFSTGGGMSGTQMITKIAARKGIKVCEQALPIKLGLRNHTMFGGKGDIVLSEKESSAIEAFVKQVLASLSL